MQTRLDSLDIARAFANLQVVFEHAVLWAGVVGLGSPALVTVEWHVVVVAAIFLMITGFVSARAIQDPTIGFRRFVAKRVMPIAWVYLVWQLSVFVYRAVAAAFLPVERPYDLVQELGRVATFLVRPNGELWYLWVILVASVALRLLRNVRTGWLLAVAVPLSVVTLSFGSVVVPVAVWEAAGLGWQRLLSYAVFFVVGVRLVPAWAAALERCRWPAVAVLGVVWQGALLALPLVGVTAGAVLRFLAVSAGAAFWVALAQLLVRRGLGRRLARFGRDVLPVYLLHMPVMVFTSVAASATGLVERAAGTAWGPLVLVVALVALGVVVPTAVHRAVRMTRADILFSAPSWWRALPEARRVVRPT